MKALALTQAPRMPDADTSSGPKQRGGFGRNLRAVLRPGQRWGARRGVGAAYFPTAFRCRAGPCAFVEEGRQYLRGPRVQLGEGRFAGALNSYENALPAFGRYARPSAGCTSAKSRAVGLAREHSPAGNWYGCVQRSGRDASTALSMTFLVISPPRTPHP